MPVCAEPACALWAARCEREWWMGPSPVALDAAGAEVPECSTTSSALGRRCDFILAFSFRNHGAFSHNERIADPFPQLQFRRARRDRLRGFRFFCGVSPPSIPRLWDHPYV